MEERRPKSADGWSASNFCDYSARQCVGPQHAAYHLVRPCQARSWGWEVNGVAGYLRRETSA